MSKSFKKWYIPSNDRELVAAILTRFAFGLDPEIIEWEVFETVRDFINEFDLDVNTVDTLARLVRASKFDPETDLWN